MNASLLAAVAGVQADVDQNELDGDNDRALIRSEFAAADTALQTSLSAAIAAVQADVDQNELDADAAIAAETAARTAAVSALQADVDQNEADADAAIALVDARVDAILSGSSSALDQFVEVVAAYEAADSNLQTSITNLSTAAAADRAAIRSEFAAADSALETSLLGGASSTHDTLKKIEDLLNAEVADRIADVNAEETRALAAEAVLAGDIAAEQTARIAAVAAVQADVDQNEADGDADRALIRTEFAAADATEAAARISGDAAINSRTGQAAGFRVENTVGDYAMHWGSGKPRMELTLDGSGGVDVCFSVQP
jgi:hypothetical protein